MIIPDEIMPRDPETGEKVDIVFNPLGIFGRNNWGVIFELALSKIIEDIQRVALKVVNGSEIDLDAAAGLLNRISMLDEGFISKYDQEYSEKINQYLVPSLTSAMVHENYQPIMDFAQDIVEKGFYIYVPNFPKVKYNDFYKDLIQPYSDKFKVNFGKSKVKLDEDLITWLREKWHFKNSILKDETYESEIEAFIGTNYMLKLYHTAYSKYTSVSLANSYSKITGQPVRGRKKVGGQHISWQTLAALLGHKENNGILKELYTIKSDAPIKDKEKFLMQYITTGEYNLKPKYVSLTKRAVNNALKILGMQFEE
jgi:DNA-directed RNA polymerase beta subunit